MYILFLTTLYIFTLYLTYWVQFIMDTSNSGYIGILGKEYVGIVNLI